MGYWISKFFSKHVGIWLEEKFLYTSSPENALYPHGYLPIHMAVDFTGYTIHSFVNSFNQDSLAVSLRHYSKCYMGIRSERMSVTCSLAAGKMAYTLQVSLFTALVLELRAVSRARYRSNEWMKLAGPTLASCNRDQSLLGRFPFNAPL